MLGRFLEVSVHAPDVAASLAFYESLGFVQAPVGDAWVHPYAVVTDGRLHLGLHGRPVESPTLAWVRPGLARHVPALAAAGVTIDLAVLDDASLHRLEFRDPSGQPVKLLEARTYSPPPLPAAHASLLGYFEEFGLPTTDVERDAAFWESMGFVAFEPQRRPFPRAALTSSDLNLGLYDLDLRAPVLCYSDPGMPARISALRERGCEFVARLPRGLASSGVGILVAPEGTSFLLTTGFD
jgi:catechol 2,3-dioxygenase-like lactoylglutathione lyase family enzyme